MTATLEQIKELRNRTGAGVVDVKAALDETSGNIDDAIAVLRKKGITKAAKKADRSTGEGYIASYVHGNGKIAVLVALACETDFVARNEKFQEVAKDIALHIAASDPQVINPDDVPVEAVEAEKQIALADENMAKKPADIQEKIIEGKLKKFKEDKALMTQVFVKDSNKTIQDVINEAIHELGENISVADFKRLSI